MRRRSVFLIAAFLLGACMNDEPRRVAFCDLASGDAEPGFVRTRAHVVVSNHGSYLADPACPRALIAWEDSAELRRSPEFERLEETRRDIMFIDERGPLVLSADVEGRFVNGRATQAGVLRISRVHSLAVVQSPPELAAP